jgi:hypothetical protein
LTVAAMLRIRSPHNDDSNIQQYRPLVLVTT